MTAVAPTTGVQTRRSARLGLDPRGVIAALLFVVVGALLFWKLGYYALWDDEANTALYGEAVWRSGDTNAVAGHNIVAYRDGLELQGLKNRLIAPLPYYVEAPFVGLLGRNARAARLPFALFGLLGLLLALHWLRRERAPVRTWILVALGICGNVSLMLYTRQARYYPLALFCILAAVYLYLHWDGRRRTLLGLAAAMIALLASHYVLYAGFVVALGLDYLLFGRRRIHVARRDLLLLVGSQAGLGGLIVSIWNPLSKPVTAYQPANWIGDKLMLVWWYLRDLNAAEFGAVALLLVGPALYLETQRRSVWLLRLPLAIVAYVAGVVLASPQPLGLTEVADVRYAVPTIPAFIYLGVVSLESLAPPQEWSGRLAQVRSLAARLPSPFRLPLPGDWPRYLAALLLFGTNLVQVGTAFAVGGPVGPPRATPAAFVGELLGPMPNPYAATAGWINANVEPGASVLTFPDYATYPLMFHAPHPVYAWQLERSHQPQYSMLADIHFRAVLLPDYVVAFGEDVAEARYVVDSAPRRGARYVAQAHLRVPWSDQNRPELFFHSFQARPFGNPSSDGVFIFRRDGPPDGTTAPDADPAIAIYDVELTGPSGPDELYRLGGVLYPDDYSGPAVIEFVLHDPSSAETFRFDMEVELTAGRDLPVALQIKAPHRPYVPEMAARRSAR